jgi:hypothetical protein
MPTEPIKCPDCGAPVSGFRTRIRKEGGRNLMVYSCPGRRCGRVFKEKEVKFSQASRLAFIVVFIPAAMFVSVWVAVSLDGTLPFYFNQLSVYFILGLIAVFYFFLLKRLKSQSDPKEILGESAYAAYQAEAEKDSAPGASGADPLMDAIRRKTALNLRAGEARPRPAYKYLRQALVIVAVAALAVPSVFRLFDLHFQLGASRETTKEEILDLEAGLMLQQIRYHKSRFGRYPAALPVDPGIKFEDSAKTEKKYFGETLGPEDFQYASDGQSFSLCAKAGLGGKCWYK